METDLSLLSSIYSISGVVITLLYIPQFLAVYKSQSDLKDISIPTWFIWTICLAISSAYAFLVAKDIKIFLVYLAGTFFCGAISLCAFHKKKKFKSKAEL
mgnify:CR=1 FL=1